MRLLILTSSTGTGHDMRARALREWAARLTDWRVEIDQALENAHPVYRLGVGVYNTIQRVWPALHHVYYAYLERAAMVRSPRRILGADRFRAVVEATAPDVVLSTHDHLNHGFFALAREVRGPDRVRCVTYCGELHGGYGFSRHWVNPEADLFIGAVDECTRAAIDLGMPPSRARTGGLLLRPGFFDGDGDPGAARPILEELDLDADAFTLVLGTGSAGANNHVAVVERLARRGRALQVIALCGRNARVRRAIAERPRIGPVEVRGLGYTERMPELLRAASAIFARPGTGTTSEALACACPVVFNGIGGVMPQERITIRFAEHHRFGRLVRRAGDLARVLDEWQDDGQALARERRRMAEARPAGHPRDILGMLA